MPGYNRIVYEVIEKCNIVLAVIDARFISKTRNIRLEDKIRSKGKVLIHVINKSDCVEKDYLEKIKDRFRECVFVSAKNHMGMKRLKERIKIISGRMKLKQVWVGVIGYPNVGKSSIINSFKGKGSARTSSEAGFTKGMQYVRISRDILMVDTPGVIAKEKDKEEELVLVGAKNPSTIKDPDIAVTKLMNDNPGLVEKKYGVDKHPDKQETIEEIAIKLNMKKKGGMADVDRACRRILHDWVKGKIGKQ